MSASLFRKGRVAALLFCAIATGVAGCDRGPGVKLVNGLGQPVVLRFEAERRQRSVVVKPGGAKTINGMTASGGYSVVVDGCVLTYPDPKFDSAFNHPWYVPDGKGSSQPDYRYSYPVLEELRADGRLHLGGSHRRAGAPDEEAHGFPLSPLSKTCPAG